VQKNLQQAAARKRLGMSPLEETALYASSKSTAPVEISRDLDAAEIQRNELIGKLTQ
jgi:hypothetical protein